MNQLNELRFLLHQYRDNQASPEETQRLFQLLPLLPQGQEEIKSILDEEAVLAIEALRQQEVSGVAAASASDLSSAMTQRMRENIFTRVAAEQLPVISVSTRTASNPWKRYWSMAAVALLALGVSLLSYYWRQSTLTPAAYKSYQTGPAEMVTLQMPDGSIIRLNSHSKIEFPARFNQSATREVLLTGEAFFEVAKNPEKPFVITTTQAVVRVLGTAFNVKESRHDTTVIVAVREGRVVFKSNGPGQPQAIELGKNQIGVLKKEVGITRTDATDLGNYLSWYHGRLLFRNTPLVDVVRQLSQLYETSIKIQDPSLENLRFTANMKRESLPVVMQQLGLSLNIRYSRQGDTLLLHR